MAAPNLNQPPLVVIAGPTASGKTDLAIRMAKKYNGEIICADSRTVYRSMDIGTAKPTPEEQAMVPHWGLDLVDPGEFFSVAQFKDYANTKIAEIRSRGRVPFLVGGTGLYIDAVLFDFRLGDKADEGLRRKLENMSVQDLQNHCINNNIELPENYQNKRYLTRAIERNGISSIKNDTPIVDSVVVGIATNREILRSRIVDRVECMLDGGVVKETQELMTKYSLFDEPYLGTIYPFVASLMSKELTREEVIEKVATQDWRLAKRQMTWFRRNPFMMWCDLESAEHYLSRHLADK